MSFRKLTDEQISEARRLREQMGFTKYELAREFHVAPTTIFYNLYGRKRKTNKVYKQRKQQPEPVYAYVDITGFLLIVEDLRNKGLTSGQIAQVFDVPVEQINLIWCKTL